jgi:hypothetical protein
LANPAALVGQVVEGLRGFAERAQKLSRSAATHRTGSAGTEKDVRVADLHGGPALEGLESSGGEIRRSAAVGTSAGQVEGLIDALVESLQFSLEAHLVGRGATQISSSANSVIRGQ